MSFWGSGKGISNLTNYGKMGAIEYSGSETMTLNNLGTITQRQGTNLKATNGKILIKNYALEISENTETFNKSTSSQSHIVTSGSVSFKGENSKIILDFGNNFEFDAEYKTANIASGLSVDFSRLVPKSDIYTLTQSGQYFIAKLAPEHSTIGNLYKSNIRTMNNFQTISNSMIFPRKSQNLRSLSSLRASEYERGNPHIKESLDFALDSTLDSANHLKSYESFSYKSEAQTRRIQRQNKRNYNRKTNNAESSTKSQGRLPRATSRARNDNFNNSVNESQNLHDYYFILTPFINHNYFFESGRYNLSGLEYGFLTAFSGKLTQSNTLGTHFMMSYGTLGDSKDKNFHIKNINLNLGINYKLDLVWDSYLKARGDFYYFLNQIKTLTIFDAIKPNNIGFGLSVAYGKDFDFKDNGILGIEVGLDYKALQSSTIELHDNTYQKNLYNLIYLDLGLNYNKYFNTQIGLWGLNAGLGIKGNITANKLAKSQIHINNLNRNVNMVLDNDNFLGYANISASYVLNHKDFDMEFSLAYYGNYGDRVISNGGGVEWRVVW